MAEDETPAAPESAPAGEEPGGNKPFFDVEQAIERASSKTTIRELQRRGFRNVKVLDHRKINELIRQAVETAFARRGKDAGEETRELMEKEAHGEFMRLLAGEKKAVQEEVERNKQFEVLEAEVKRLLARAEEADAEVERARLQTSEVRRELEETQRALGEAERRAAAAAGSEPGAKARDSDELSVEGLRALEERIKQVLFYFGDIGNRRSLAEKDLSRIDIEKDFDLRLSVLIAKFLDLQLKEAHIAAKAEFVGQLNALRSKLESLRRDLDGRDAEIAHLRKELREALAVRVEGPEGGEDEAGEVGEEGADPALLRFRSHGNYVKRSRKARKRRGS